MSQEKVKINRTLVGILTLGCFAAAGAIYATHPHDESWRLWLAGFVRVGLLMSAFWLALPTQDRDAAWANVSWTTFAGLLLALIVVVRLPLRIVLPLLVVLTVVGIFLRPRAKRRPGSRPHRFR